MNVQTINSSVQQLALSAVPAGGLFVYGGAAWLKSVVYGDRGEFSGEIRLSGGTSR